MQQVRRTNALQGSQGEVVVLKDEEFGFLSWPHELSPKLWSLQLRMREEPIFSASSSKDGIEIKQVEHVLRSNLKKQTKNVITH